MQSFQFARSSTLLLLLLQLPRFIVQAEMQSQRAKLEERLARRKGNAKRRLKGVCVQQGSAGVSGGRGAWFLFPRPAAAAGGGGGGDDE